MKILFVTAVPLQYSSSANMRNMALIKGLKELGHTVDSLSSEADSSNPIYDESLTEKYIDDRIEIRLGALHSSIGKTRENSLKSRLKIFLYRMMNRYSVYDLRRSLVRRIDQLGYLGHYDLIISSSDPKSSHLLAEALREKNIVKADRWIQYWGDPFTGDINNQSGVPEFIVAREEKRILSKADKAVFVSPFTLKMQQEKYPEMADSFEFCKIPIIEKIFFEDHENKVFTLGYFGDYFKKDRDLTPLMEAVNRSSEDMKLLVYGRSDLNAVSSERIEIHGREKGSVIKKTEGGADLLVCVLNRRGTQIPGKIYHYAATNKAILVLIDGEREEDRQLMREYFVNFQRFYICDNDADEILKMLRQIKQEKGLVTFEPLEELEGIRIAEEFIR